LADFFALSEARLNDHGLTIDFRVNNPIDPICKIPRFFLPKLDLTLVETPL